MKPQDLVERALAASSVDGCVVLAETDHSVNLRWANNTMTTNGAARSRDVTVISVVNGADGMRAASVTRSGVSGDDIADLVRESEAVATRSVPAEDAAPLVAGAAAADWDEPPGETSVDVLAAIVEALAESFQAATATETARYGYAEQTVSTTYLGSSTGLRLRHVQPDGRLEQTGRSGDGSRSAWAGTARAELSAADVATIEADLGRRLEWSRRHVDLPAGRYDTVLPPSAVADFLVDMYWTMGARDAQEGTTVFSRRGGGTRVGERLSDVPLTLRSDPAMPDQLCAPFVTAGASSRLSSVFDNGLPLGPIDWIRDGTLEALLQTRHSAELTGLPVTPWVDNLELVAGDARGGIDDLVAGVERGLLLTCLWYIREVDPQTMLLTGLTRDGVFLVEHGEVVGVTNNFRFNESPVAMMRRIAGATGTERTLAREFGDYFTRTRMPALRIDDFNMSSVSQAS